MSNYRIVRRREPPKEYYGGLVATGTGMGWWQMLAPLIQQRLGDKQKKEDAATTPDEKKKVEEENKASGGPMDLLQSLFGKLGLGNFDVSKFGGGGGKGSFMGLASGRQYGSGQSQEETYYHAGLAQYIPKRCTADFDYSKAAYVLKCRPKASNQSQPSGGNMPVAPAPGQSGQPGQAPTVPESSLPQLNMAREEAGQLCNTTLPVDPNGQCPPGYEPFRSPDGTQAVDENGTPLCIFSPGILPGGGLLVCPPFPALGQDTSNYGFEGWEDAQGNMLDPNTGAPMGPSPYGPEGQDAYAPYYPEQLAPPAMPMYAPPMYAPSPAVAPYAPGTLLPPSVGPSAAPSAFGPYMQPPGAPSLARGQRTYFDEETGEFWAEDPSSGEWYLVEQTWQGDGGLFYPGEGNLYEQMNGVGGESSLGAVAPAPPKVVTRPGLIPLSSSRKKPARAKKARYRLKPGKLKAPTRAKAASLANKMTAIQRQRMATTSLQRAYDRPKQAPVPSRAQRATASIAPAPVRVLSAPSTTSTARATPGSRRFAPSPAQRQDAYSNIKGSTMGGLEYLAGCNSCNGK